MQIEPHIGTDTLRFGATLDEVRALLGEPEESETADLDGDVETTVWHYWEKGLSLFFDSDTGNRLTTLEVDTEEATLGGKPVVGLAVDQVPAFLESISAPAGGHDDPEFVEVGAWDLNLWIEDGVVESVQWEVRRDDEDRPVWPEGAA